jgi:DNA-binding GntR family transcriptional regulator
LPDCRIAGLPGTPGTPGTPGLPGLPDRHAGGWSVPLGLLSLPTGSPSNRSQGTDNVKDDTSRKRRLVQETAEQLRDLILESEPGAQIGSLNEVAEQFGVGIVTVQQAARILEYEGLLAVKRGPGGGYYGTRPDEAALERAFTTFMRVYNFGYREAFEMMLLLDCDIIPTAAASRDTVLRAAVEELNARIDHCESPEDRVQFEKDLRDTLFKVDERPFLEFLARVTLQLYRLQSKSALFSDPEIVAVWKAGRGRILEAILQRDGALARFEAERYRQTLLLQLHAGGSPGAKSK